MRPLLNAPAIGDARARFEAAAAYSDARGGVALIVVDGDAVVFAHGSRAARPIYSGVKGLLCPLAMASGVELDEATAAGPSVRELLTMTSGLDDAHWWSEVEGSRRPVADRYAFALSLAIRNPRGTTFQYSGMHAAAFGGHLAAHSVDPRKLVLATLRSLGITRPKWSSDGAGQPILSHGMSLTPLQWARIGVMMRDGAGTTFAPCLRGTRAMPAYGIGWWLNTPIDARAAGQIPPSIRDHLTISDDGAEKLALFAPGPPDLFAAFGDHDQRMYVIPSRDWVIVHMARRAPNARSTDAIKPFIDGEFLALLL